MWERTQRSLARRGVSREAYLRVLGRRPDADEIDSGLSYVQALRQKWNNIDEEKAWTSFTHALMASNEFIFVY